MSPILRIGVAAALLLGGLGAAGCSAPPVCACMSPPPPRLMYVVTVNGRSGSYDFPAGNQPRFHIRPGEKLQMKVAVAVPRHLRLTTLWFGISTGTYGGAANGKPPIGLHPILAHSLHQLLPGVHRFVLYWRVPARSSGSVFLVSFWSSHHPPVSPGGPIAVLALNSGK